MLDKQLSVVLEKSVEGSLMVQRARDERSRRLVKEYSGEKIISKKK
ncbi:MAG: hypothetical protein ACFFCS_04040 [Candidatus Hodarchaeota archaeon]